LAAAGVEGSQKRKKIDHDYQKVFPNIAESVEWTIVAARKLI